MYSAAEGGHGHFQAVEAGGLDRDEHEGKSTLVTQMSMIQRNLTIVQLLQQEPLRRPVSLPRATDQQIGLMGLHIGPMLLNPFWVVCTSYIIWIRAFLKFPKRLLIIYLKLYGLCTSFQVIFGDFDRSWKLHGGGGGGTMKHHNEERLSRQHIVLLSAGISRPEIRAGSALAGPGRRTTLRSYH